MSNSGATIHRFSCEAMATFFEILIRHEDATYAGQGAAAAFREINRLEELLSRFDERSDIAQINRLSNGEMVRVGFETVECLTIAAEVCSKTQGAFDITFRPGKQGSDMRWLWISEAPPFSVSLQQGLEAEEAGIRLDLGAVGKGYALDRAAEILREWEIEHALLHSGTSSALALGAESDDVGGWMVGVGGDWGASAGYDRFLLSGSALSGSGTEVKGEHIIDPHTGKPASEHLAAWALCATAARSDAYSTAFMIMSTEAVRTVCETNDGVSAAVVERDSDGPGRLVLIGKGWK